MENKFEDEAEYYYCGRKSYLQLSEKYMKYSNPNLTELDPDVLGMIIVSYLHEMQKHYKDLEVFLLTNGSTPFPRHVCVEDNDMNRRRYWAMKNYVERKQKELKNYVNNLTEEDVK